MNKSERKKEALKLRLEGKTYKQIGEDLNLSKQGVINLLSGRQGARTRGELKKEEIIKLYAELKNMQTVADKVGCSVGTVFNWLKKAGIESNIQKPRQKQ